MSPGLCRGNNWNLKRKKNAKSWRAYPAALGSRVSSLYISTRTNRQLCRAVVHYSYYGLYGHKLGFADGG